MGSVTRIEAISTKYNGVQFRSKLEARVAAMWDRQGLLWAYEPKALLRPGISYQPDFYLICPKKDGVTRHVIEVKGLLSPWDCSKIHLYGQELMRRPDISGKPLNTYEVWFEDRCWWLHLGTRKWFV